MGAVSQAYMYPQQIRSRDLTHPGPESLTGLWVDPSYKYCLIDALPTHMYPPHTLLHLITWCDLNPLGGGGGRPLVFKGGYHAQVWALQLDPKLAFWVISKSHPKQWLPQVSHTLNWDLSNSGIQGEKIIPIQGYGTLWVQNHTLTLKQKP